MCTYSYLYMLIHGRRRCFGTHNLLTSYLGDMFEVRTGNQLNGQARLADEFFLLLARPGPVVEEERQLLIVRVLCDLTRESTIPPRRFIPFDVSRCLVGVLS